MKCLTKWKVGYDTRAQLMVMYSWVCLTHPSEGYQSVRLTLIVIQYYTAAIRYHSALMIITTSALGTRGGGLYPGSWLQRRLVKWGGDKNVGGSVNKKKILCCPDIKKKTKPSISPANNLLLNDYRPRQQ